LTAFKGATLTFVLERFDAGPPLYGVQAMQDFDPKRDAEVLAEQVKNVIIRTLAADPAAPVAESPK
jgi:homoserine acetyltransferase